MRQLRRKMDSRGIEIRQRVREELNMLCTCDYVQQAGDKSSDTLT